MNKKGICKNCADQIGEDSNSNEFCSEQCGVEYQLEHDKKWYVMIFLNDLSRLIDFFVMGIKKEA